MTQRGCPACQDRNEYNEKRDHAYRLLLAYAECEEAVIRAEPFVGDRLTQHGWDGLQFVSGFLVDLRNKALEAARAAEAT